MAYNSTRPSFHILICLIKIWTAKDLKDPLAEPDSYMLISEVENIEIVESYKKLIGTASVRFPRGTVVRKTVTQINESEVAADNKLQVSLDDAGIVQELRNTTSMLTTSHFSIGQRIRIYLGYTEDPAVAALAKVNNTKKNIFNDTQYLRAYQEGKLPSDTAPSASDNSSQYNALKSMNIMFDGYITKISVDSPIELHCENLAYRLKQITCKGESLSSKNTVNNFLSENGRFKLLKGTGLTLYPETEAQRFDLGKVDLPPDLTVADILRNWSRYGLHAFVKEYNGKPTIAIGRSYFSNAQKDSIINLADAPTQPVDILFDYHVARNNLSLQSTDKRFLAVKAQGLGSDGKFINITVLRNPAYDQSGDITEENSPYRTVNKSNLSKKQMKLGVRNGGSETKVSMDLYTVISYHSRKIPVTEDELTEEAIKYLESYNMNGIDGTITIFGDLHLHTATKVHLVDNRHPGKNGYYVVDEVTTTFGTDGYRQTLKLPYCIKRDNQEESNGEE